MIARRLLSLKRDQRGVVAPFVAVLGVVLVGTAGLATDVGFYYVGNRNLRSATEAAALAAAIDPANATARAQAYLVRNGYDASVLKSVQVGRYCADSTIAAANRFDLNGAAGRCTGNGLSTAVRLQTSKVSRRYLTSVFGSAVPIPTLAATATAARIDEAGVGITTGILTVNDGLVGSVNDLLGALLNIHLTLNAAQIGGLMSSNIDAGRFFDALAARVGETGTYSDLTGRSVPLADILYAAATAATASGNTTTAATFTSLAGQVGSSFTVPLSGLFGLGVWSKMPVGEATTQPSLRAGLNAYQLLAFAIQGSGGKIDLSDAVSRVVSGSTVRISGLATGPLDRPRFAFGPQGETRVGTSALRLRLELGLGNIALLGQSVAVNSVPLLIDIAAGTASIDSIRCGEEAAQDTVVNVNTATGLVNAYIGTAPANAMTSPMPILSASDITDATLLNVTILGTGVSATARAIAQPVFGNSKILAFGPGGNGTIGKPPASGNAATLGNGSQVGPLLTSLGNNLNVTVNLCVLGICNGSVSVNSQLVSGITTPLGGLVGTVADPVLDNLLAALGIQLGSATVWVTGARCGVPVLV